MRLISNLLFLLIVGVNSLYGLSHSKVSEQELGVLSKVAAILAASHSPQQDQVWPGYDLTQSPVVITFESGHIFVFNMHSNNPEWQKLKIQNGEVLYCPEDQWGLTKSAFQPQFPLEGHKAYVFNLDNALRDDGSKSYQILVHERFHRYQFEHFHVHQGNRPYQDHLNSENLALGKLEEKILTEFMQDHGNPALQMEHLRNFASVNAVRRALIQSSSREWEDHQEMMEGLADYVSYKILDVFPILSGFDGSREMAAFLQMEVSNTDYADHAIKWRHYGVGAALAYALDFLEVKSWKQAVEQGQKNLLEMLQEKLALTPLEIETRFENCQSQYQWEETIAAISGSVHKFAQEIEKHVADYQKMEGVILEIGRPRTGLSGSGKNARLIYLPDGSTLSIQDHLNSASEDNLWKLKLESVPYVFKKGNGSIEFKLEPQTIICLDNQKYKISDLISNNMQRPFTHIEIQAKNLHFTSDKHPGLLTIFKNKTLIVSF